MFPNPKSTVMPLGNWHEVDSMECSVNLGKRLDHVTEAGHGLFLWPNPVIADRRTPLPRCPVIPTFSDL